MVNRSPGVIWTLRRNGHGSWVQTGDSDTIRVGFPDPENDTYAYVHVLSRKDARLLAKRINQCLDATTKGKKK